MVFTSTSTTVVGTFTDSDIGVGASRFVLISYPYLDEARTIRKGTVNHFNVAVSDPKLAVQVADAIDRRTALVAFSLVQSASIIRMW